MQAHSLLLARCYAVWPDHVHDGKVVTLRSNLRWWSDGFEFTCWNGDMVQGAFLIDAHDRQVIAWRAVANAGISGADVQDTMFAAVAARFETHHTSQPVEVLIDDGSAYTARETRIFARQLGLKPCFTPVRSPQSNGVSEVFVHTLKRDYVWVNPCPDPQFVLLHLPTWPENYNTVHPHGGLRMLSPREFIAKQSTIPAASPV